MRVSHSISTPLARTAVVAHRRNSCSRRGLSCFAVAASPPATTLTLHVDQTSISFPLGLDEGRRLQTNMRELLQTFAAKQKAERPQKWKSMEFRVKGDPSEQELEFLEIFCNPNAAATAFDAKALITIKTKEGVRITTEGRISSLKEDLDSYMTQHA